jgi:hypothetical protein
MKIISSLFKVPIIIGLAMANNIDQHGLTSVFPDNGPSMIETKGFSFSKTYSSSGSSWSTTWNENRVFEAMFKYENENHINEEYELRIGQGGQIYSFITSTGEAIPPQFRTDSKEAPWVDEVWQLVAVDKKLNDRDNHAHYYIHQAGVYLRDSQNLNIPFYSPQIAEYYNAKNQEYTTVNWGQHAHIGENLSNGFTSAILYYTKFKNLGRGLIQVDYLLYNFGNDNINHINMPWGGVRHSTFGNFFISNSNGTYTHQTGGFTSTSFETNQTDGWTGFSSNDQGTAPSLALLSDNSTGKIRIGDAANIPERNYTAYSNIRTNIDLSFGKQLHIRNYFVLGGTMDAVKNKINNTLKDKTNNSLKTIYSFENKNKNKVDSAFYFFHEKNSTLSASVTTNQNGLHLKKQPYKNSYPIFLIKNKTGITRVTTNLYTFSKLPYDGKTTSIKLLGFSDEPTTVKLEYDTICAGANYTFYDGHTKTNINSNMKYISRSGVTTDGESRFIQTTLTIKDKSKISPRSQINDGETTSELSLSIDLESALTLKPQVIKIADTIAIKGDWNWSGPKGLSNSQRILTIDSYKRSSDGNYTITYTNANNCKDSLMYTLTSTITSANMNNYIKGKGIQANLIANTNISYLETKAIISAQVFAMSGKLILSFRSESENWNVSKLPLGRYQIRFHLKNGVQHDFYFIKE